MDWINCIQKSIEYIETHICEELNVEFLASSLYVSNHQFQKMFSLLCECPVGEYIRNRRLTLAGYELMATDQTIIEIAVKYGYQTNESFTRAFNRFHGASPSAIRKGEATLNTFSKISVKSKVTGDKRLINDFTKRGYVIKETGMAYYTEHMEKTIKWFEEVLGWYGQIETKDYNDKAIYGRVNSIPLEVEMMSVAPFVGIRLYYGVPVDRVIGCLEVDGIERLYHLVKRNNWHSISPIIYESWGAKSCEITTIDGSILRFYELQGYKPV